MKYLEWNNIISDHLFNSENIGKEVHLYLTKNDIINLGSPYFEEGKKEDVWVDYISSIKWGIPGSKGNVIEKAKYAFLKNQLLGLTKNDGTPTSIDSIPVLFPAYISYLVFFVLPLIEINDSNRRANDYYGRLNEFLINNNLNETKKLIGTSDFRDNQINFLWEDLSIWANVKKNRDFGFFNAISFSNPHWVYVGKVFSQCVLPSIVINRLPELFKILNLVPNIIYDNIFLKEKILNSRTEIIPNRTIEFLKKDDELSASIIQTIQSNYKKWSGETHEEISSGNNLKKKRNFTIARLFLQLNINTNDEEIKLSYRIFSSNDYPEDLKFGLNENLYELNGWSKPLSLEFKEGLEIKDNFNKWIAKFPERDVRLFISAGVFQLSSSFWIETDTLSRIEPMYLLCKKDKLQIIKDWGCTFSNGSFRHVNFDGLPENYSLFYFFNPIKSHPEFPILTLYTEKRINLTGGLKINFRTYVNDFLPLVEVVNSDGQEKIYLQYKNTIEKIYLNKKGDKSNFWFLPDKILLNTDFYIKIEGEFFSGNELAYTLTSSENMATKVDGATLPKRDPYGRQVLLDSVQYCLGSNLINPMKSSIRYYCPLAGLFTPNIEDYCDEIYQPVFFNHPGNMMASFLTLKGSLTTEEYYTAFEFYFTRLRQNIKQENDFNLSKLKRSSLNFYDYIGFLDFDYESKKIVVNPPQIIFIPSSKGRKALLIGARDQSFIRSLISRAFKYELQVEIKKQFSSNLNLLLPDVITINSYGDVKKVFGERDILALANDLGIRFSYDYFPQYAFLEFSVSIKEYEKSLEVTDQNDYGWARKVFNTQTLKYEKSENNEISKELSLVEYKLNEYTYYNKLWKNGVCYKIDKNWGRYIVLKEVKKNVILFDSKRKRVAIPIEMPLPRLLAESLMLLSGFAPDVIKIDNKHYRTYENVPGLITENIFLKLDQQPIKKDIL